MGWQKISSGRIYESSRGHAFIISGIYKRIIGMVLYSNTIQKCDAADKRDEEAEENNSPKKFQGTSKSMEASV